MNTATLRIQARDAAADAYKPMPGRTTFGALAEKDTASLRQSAIDCRAGVLA